MTESGWYVIQVRAGREQAMCEAIRRACDETAADDGEALRLEECFSPTCVHRLKYHGEWCDFERPLLPGYVVAVTPNPVALIHKLHRIREFSRMLTMAETIVPLREEERAWIDENTTAGERVIPISVGYRKGDTVVVTEGPLKGREAIIERVIRKKCVAILKIHAGNVTITTEVGLALLPQKTA